MSPAVETAYFGVRAALMGVGTVLSVVLLDGLLGTLGAAAAGRNPPSQHCSRSCATSPR